MPAFCGDTAIGHRPNVAKSASASSRSAGLLRNSFFGRGLPFTEQNYPTASVTGMPGAVQPLTNERQA